MAARRRVDIFFILYLTAIVGFVVVSKERDTRDKEMQELNNEIARTLLSPVPLHPERDTLRCYVDADSSGVVAGDPGEFHTFMYVRDIAPDDTVTLSVHSVIFEDTLISSDIVRIGPRTGVGEPHDNLVAFPVSADFQRTGRYEVNFTARTRRVHEVESGVFSYRGIRFDTTLVSRALIREIEQRRRSVVFIVEDTSVTVPKMVPSITMSLDRVDIVSSIGFEETNRITVNLGWADPSMSIVRGGGSLRRVSKDARSVEYLWSGEVTAIPDTVVLEARAFRGAGGKDIARARFVVSGRMPFLAARRPEYVYSGEAIDFDISVPGLEQAGLYRWELHEDAGRGVTIMKSEGRSPRVAYRIPNNFAGKKLIVDATYGGRRYRVYSRRSFTAGDSRFVLRVVEPPTRIGLVLPVRASRAEAFGFTASRYHNPAFRGEQPIDRLGDVRVELRNENDRVLEADVWMVRKGEFEFALVDRAAIRKGGERILVIVHAGGSTVRSSLELY